MIPKFCPSSSFFSSSSEEELTTIKTTIKVIINKAPITPIIISFFQLFCWTSTFGTSTENSLFSIRFNILIK